MINLKIAAVATKAIQSLPFNSFWDSLKTNLKSLATDLQDISGWIAVIALVIAAVMFFFGGEGVRAGKRQVLWVLVGIAVIAGAFAIVGTIQDTFSFSTDLAAVLNLRL